MVMTYYYAAEDALIVSEELAATISQLLIARSSGRPSLTVMSVAQATVTQNVSHPPLRPKYGFPFCIVVDGL